MPIIDNGIFLPNGMFLPNRGDGHAKNAWRFCEKYEPLKRFASESFLNTDEFMITAGCCIVAGYDGVRCFKVASDNPHDFIRCLTKSYEFAEFKIWKYWNIDEEARGALEQVIENMPKMQIVMMENN